MTRDGRFGSLTVLWLVLVAAYVYLVILAVELLFAFCGGFSGSVIVVGSTMGSSLFARFAGFVFESAILTNGWAPLSVLFAALWSMLWIHAITIDRVDLRHWSFLVSDVAIAVCVTIGFSRYLVTL